MMHYVYDAPLRGLPAPAVSFGTYGRAWAAAGVALLLVLLAGTAQAQAPTFSGAVSLNPDGIYGSSVGQATAVDAAGNQYVTGTFSGRIKVGGTTLTASGNSDIYVAKRRAATGAWLWAVRAGGPGTSTIDNSFALAVDASGNALITGTLLGPATFDTLPTGTTLPATSNNNIFVAKFGTADGVCAWAVQASGPNYSVGQGIAADANGNAVVTGYISGTVSFGTQPTATALTSGGTADVFVAKFGAADGVCAWAVKAGGATADQGRGIGVDASGNILVAGIFFNTATFGTTPSATTLTAAGGTDVFVAKFEGAAGTCLWAVRAGGSSSGGTAGDYAQGLAVDASGNALVAGYFTSSATFATAPTATTLTAAGGPDAFVAKFDGAAGACAWAVRAGGAAADQANAIAADAGGNALVTGYFTGTATFGAGPTRTAAGGPDVFVAKFGAAAGACAWATAGGGSSDDYGYGIATDASDNVLVAGSFSSAASFGSAADVFAPGVAMFVGQLAGGTGAWQATAQANGGSTSIGQAAATDAAGNQYVTGMFTGILELGGTTLGAAGGGDAFVAKRSAAGAWLWAARIGGSSSADYGYGLALDASGNALVTGYFSSTASFGPGSAAPTLTAAGSYDTYVAKLGTADGVCAWAMRLGGAGSDIGQAIAADASGNALVTGYFNGPATVGTGPAALPLTATGGSYEAFVAKFAALDGTCAWAVPLSSPGIDIGQGIVADPAGNALVTGYFSGPATAGTGPTAVPLAFAGGIDVFVAKFGAATGACAWAVAQGGADVDVGEDIALDASGNVFVTGYFSTTTSFATMPTRTALVSAGRSDVFVAKFDAAAGACAWAVQAGGSDNDRGQGIAADAAGNALVTGYFTGSATFATAPTATTLTAPSAGLDSFVAKFGAAAGACAWAAGGNSRDNGFGNGGTGIVTDASGGALVTGGFTSAASFGGAVLVGGGEGNIPTSFGPSTGFLVRIAPSGPLPVALTAFTATAQGSVAVRLAWATASEQNSLAFEVERSADGVSFAKIGTVAAAGTTATAHSYALLDAALPTGASVLYYRLRQLDLDGSFSYSPVRVVALGASGVALFPNPAHGGAATLTGVAAGQAVQVFDALGRLVLSATADASGTAALVLSAGLSGGVYVVRAGAQALRLAVE